MRKHREAFVLGFFLEVLLVVLSDVKGQETGEDSQLANLRASARDDDPSASTAAFSNVFDDEPPAEEEEKERDAYLSLLEAELSGRAKTEALTDDDGKPIEFLEVTPKAFSESSWDQFGLSDTAATAAADNGQMMVTAKKKGHERLGDFQYVHPRPFAFFVSPATTIAVRLKDGIKVEPSSIRDRLWVRGERSGDISGNLHVAADGSTITFRPQRMFHPDEKVTVKMAPGVVDKDGKAYRGLAWSFVVTDRPQKAYLPTGGQQQVEMEAGVEWASNKGNSQWQQSRQAMLERWDYGPFEAEEWDFFIDTPDDENPFDSEQLEDSDPDRDAKVDDDGAREPSEWPLPQADADGHDFKRFPTRYFATLPRDYPHFEVTQASGDPDKIEKGRIWWLSLVDQFTMRPDYQRPFLTIVDSNGQPVFWRRYASNKRQRVFRTSGRGNMLLFDQLERKDSRVMGGERPSREWIEMNHHYHPIERHQAAHGHMADQHDVAIREDGTRLFIIYDRQTFHLHHFTKDKAANMPKVLMVDTAVTQMVDKNGDVLLEWRAIDQWPIPVLIRGKYKLDQLLGKADYSVIDTTHPNSVSFTRDGGILLSLRPLTVLKIDMRGEVAWMLGGANRSPAFSTMEVEKGKGVSPFKFQHHTRIDDSNVLTMFDNHHSTTPLIQDTWWSQAVVYQVDEDNNTAREIRSHKGPYGFAMGSMQALPNGNAAINWGGAGKVNIPFYTEVTREGKVVLELRFIQQNGAFQTHKLPWWGRSKDPPLMVARPHGEKAPTIHFSWNGVTNVKRWEVYGGPSSPPKHHLATLNKTKFEEKLKVDGTMQQRAHCLHEATCYFRAVPLLHDGSKGIPSRTLLTPLGHTNRRMLQADGASAENVTMTFLGQQPVRIECFEHDVFMARLDVPNTPPLQADSAASCQALCAQDSSCRFFSFDEGNGRCHLKVHDGGRMYREGVVSGPRECPHDRTQEGLLHRLWGREDVFGGMTATALRNGGRWWDLHDSDTIVFDESGTS
ncbi:unnamed protein product [Vitrella brassicaformis CCMP3155]|uniref:Apple domain-containing protein n=1 Tax=Vitrella brassicaformis (strain CCMP3155) TaxID=1169540 RepID=A0A0G4G3W1_VITBC|nr:unnamed protein product [Vitrella brassicaformis CCMP3155]|eukprot:CEM22862.1 unnamed protein product [Vitrella brassicaformis CCMP3155]